MGEVRWYRADDGTFALRLPDGWQAEPDAEQGGVELSHPAGVGELSLLAFPLPPGEPPDPGEELYAFLDEHEIELEEDEIEDVELGGGGELAVCEYLTEDEETGEALFWLVGVGALPGALVFVSYTCAAGEEEGEREQVHGILRTLCTPAAD